MLQIAFSLIISAIVLAVFSGVLFLADIVITKTDAVRTEVMRLSDQDQESDFDQLQSSLANQDQDKLSLNNKSSSFKNNIYGADSGSNFTGILLSAYQSKVKDNLSGNLVSTLYSKTHAIRAPPEESTFPLI